MSRQLAEQFAALKCDHTATLVEGRTLKQVPNIKQFLLIVPS